MIEPLTDVHRAVLEFERLQWRHQGNKEAEILARFGWLPGRYYQVLTWLLRHPEAEAYDAQLVRRLRQVLARRRELGR